MADVKKALVGFLIGLFAGSLAGEDLDIGFVKGLLSIPSESRSILECNRAVA